MSEVAPEETKAGAGDNEEAKAEHVPTPEPVTVPDVELVVDGFGFMPKGMRQERKRSSVFAKTKPKANATEGKEEEGEHSPCASSTNIDIVRRYTWTTKNRMTVQVAHSNVLTTARSLCARLYKCTHRY